MSIPLAPGLSFDEGGHVYRYKGEARPSVTQVLDDNRLRADLSSVPAAALERARQRGVAVHLATHFDDEGTLDEATVDPVIWPYVQAWRAFKIARGVEIVEMERRMIHSTLGYAGTLDRVARVNLGRRRADVVLDIKTGDQTGVAFQLAAYKELYRDAIGGHYAYHRWSVVLHPERRIPYTVHEFNDLSDWRIFRAALDLTMARAALGRSWRQDHAELRTA